MSIDRRTWLQGGAAAGAVALVGGVQYARRAYARNSLYQEMMNQAVPILTGKAATELDSMPTAASNEIQDYFHGICLNVHPFVIEICSNGFAEKLAGCGSDEQKQQLLNVAFSQKVVTAVEVLRRVETIATAMGKTLDGNWADCCKSLSVSWGTSLGKHSPALNTLDVMDLVQPLIVHSLDDARRQTYPVGQRPAISESIGKIGESAILLLPVAVASPELAFPVFVFTALREVWRWICGEMANQAADYQTAVTEQLSILAIRVGAEFEQEFRRRLADLQGIRERSLANVARQKAAEAIPGLF